MIRICSFVLLIYLTAVRGQAVMFPNDNDQQQQQKPETETRTGLKYLGYFLSLLTSSYAGYQPTPVQTPSTTDLPIFSAFPTIVTNRTALPTTTTAATTMPDILPGASTFPTALPTSFPTGLVTSYGTFPPIVSPKPSEPSSAPLIATEGYICGCLPLSVCVNSTTRTGPSIRIVTSPPDGIMCPSGLVYCCAPTKSHLCGLQNVIPGVMPGSGQANLGEFPWSAIILTDGDAYVGGGALIGEFHVITAAHKVAGYGNGATLKVRFGDWDLSKTTEPVPHIEVKVKSITNHPNFDPVTLKNDISVIALARPVPTLTSPSPQINTICLPLGTDDFTGSRCWVAGWGKDQFNGAYQQIIKKVDLPVITAANCQTRLRETRLGNSFVLDAKSFVCAGGEASKDACTGDGGNALACEKNGQFFIAGITVGGIQCGLANVPGLYTNIVNFLPWINTVVTPTPGTIDPRRKPLK